MIPRRAAIARAYIVSLLAALATYLPGVWYPYWPWDPGLYAAVSLHAARDGHWWTLQHANTTYFNKPPLWFWVHAGFVRVLGEADWVLHLPDLLAALACVAILVSIVLRLHGPRVAIIAGVGLALCTEYIRRISQFRLDIPHAALMLLALRLVIAGVMPSCHRAAPAGAIDRRIKPGLIIAAGVPIGLAMMIKPVFALYALVLSGVWMVLIGRDARRAALWLIPAALVAAAIAAPWHVSMYLTHGDHFINSYFVKQSLERATGDRFSAEPWYAYFIYLSGIPTRIGRQLGGGSVAGSDAIWLVSVILAIGWWARGRIRGRKLAPRVSSAGGVLAQVWTFGFLLALSAFGDKKSWYLMPVYPGLSWIAALLIARVTPRKLRIAARHAALPAAAVGLLAVLVIRPSFERDTGPLPDLSSIEAYLRDHPGDDYWNGSLSHYDNARLYIRGRVWPQFVFDSNTHALLTVPVGALVLYDKQKQPPDPTDAVVLDGKRFVIARRTSPDAAPLKAGTKADR
jgi:4-amino-4-deoxy-L-arabinose transferase-like glycosyltransferase